MHALMCYQIALFPESLITHCEGKGVLTTMYVLKFYKTALYTECLITHNYKGA